MVEEQVYQNYIDLFSSEEAKRIKALSSKKEWILNVFYIPYSIVKNQDGVYDGIDCLLHSQVKFHHLHLKTIETELTQKEIRNFNEKYRYMKLYSSLPIRTDKTVFYVQADFRRLDKEVYKRLVASFFWCLPHSAFKKSFFSNDPRALFQRPCEGNKDEGVVIQEKKNLLSNGRFEVDGLEKVFIYSDMNDEQKKLLEKAAEKMNLKEAIINV